MNDNAHTSRDFLFRQKAKTALALFLALMCLAGGVLWLLHHQKETALLNALKQRETSMVDLQKVLIIGNFKPIMTDLLFFAQCSQMLDMLDAPREHRIDLIKALSFFSRGSKRYDQIRVLDTRGRELVRINFTGGVPVVVPDAQLQFKGNRYYFKDTIVMNRGEIFLSPFDLNIERGEIEQPLKPTIRISTPVFDRSNRKRGIVVFNYLGEDLIRHVKDAEAGSPGDIMLLNAEGYWLIGRDPGDEWGFMHEQKKKLIMANRHPDAWNVISSSDSGQLSNSDGLFTFATINPLIEGWKPGPGAGTALAPNISGETARKYFWKLVSFVPKEHFASDAASFCKQYIFMGLLLAALFGAGSWLTAAARVAGREAKKALLRSRDELENAVKARTLELEAANQALKKSETKFRAVFQSSVDAIGVSKAGIHVFVNPAYLRLFGYADEDELAGKPITDLIASDQRDAVLDRVRRRVAGETEPSFYETKGLRKDGTEFHMEVHRSGYELGNEPGTLVILRDITVRKKADEEIKTAREELLAINRIVMACSSTLSVKEILNNVMDEALQITGLEGGTICLVGHDDTLQLAVHRAASAATISDLTTNTVKVGDCLCGECARDRKPLILADREAVLKFSTREATRGEDIRFHAAYPLVVKEKSLGVLCVFTRTDRKPHDRSLKLLETVTAQIALSIENAQLHEDTLRHAATLEDKVRERTAELETKIAESERMNRLFVDRELKMAELKARIKALEK